MDIFEQLEEKKSDNVIEKSLSNSLEKLVEMLSAITEFNLNELKAISILQSDKYLSALLMYLEKNRKHLKRKHSAEIIEALKQIALCIANSKASIQSEIEGVKK